MDRKEKMRKEFFKNVGSDKEEFKRRTCTVFGCGRILTNEEQRYGDKCICHSGGKNTNLTDLINLFLYKKR